MAYETDQKLIVFFFLQAGVFNKMSPTIKASLWTARNEDHVNVQLIYLQKDYDHDIVACVRLYTDGNCLYTGQTQYSQVKKGFYRHSSI